MALFLHLNECVEILTTPIDHLYATNSAHNPLLGSKEKIGEFFVREFTIELEENLVNSNIPKDREILIRLYVSRLMKSKNHRSIKDGLPDSVFDIPDIIISESGSGLIRRGNLLIEPQPPYDPNNRLRFMRGCNILYHLLFDELQKCCVTFEIPFLNICRVLGFPLDTINLEISTVYNDPNQLNTLNHSDLKPTNSKFTSKPRFRTDYVPEIFDFLKPYFSTDEHDELLKLLTTEGVASNHLLFRDTGSRLVDAFKQLYENKIIVSCTKKELASWIVANFKYLKNSEPTEYKPIYPVEILSETRMIVKNKIFIIKDQPGTVRKQLINPQ